MRIEGEIVLMLMVVESMVSSSCSARLSPEHYERPCLKALVTIRTTIRRAVSRERRMAASLIRLHFHESFVQVGIITTTIARM